MPVTTMQAAHLQGCDVDFAYIDSGPPGTHDYTTLVCVHGHTYHAQTFSRLLPLSAAHNVRVIAFNRRDYLGSTPFSEDELGALMSDDASEHGRFLRARGLEIAYLLVWVINELRIPRASRDREAGGLALLGWSLGNITSLAFLGHLDSYSSDLVSTLAPYLRHFFVYEPTFSFLGYSPPAGAYHPLWDADVPEHMKAAAIDTWFTSYFSHPYFALSRDLDDCTCEHRIRELASLELRTPCTPVKRPTSENRTSEELDASTDPMPAMRSEMAFYGSIEDPTLYAQFKRGLTSRAAAAAVLPELRVTVAHGTRSVWAVIWGAWEAAKDVERWKTDGLAVRPIDVVSIEGANHFVLWDDPGLLLKTLVECMKSK